MATRDPRGDGTGAVITGGGTEPMARPAAGHPENTAEVPVRDLCARSPRDLVHVPAAGVASIPDDHPGSAGQARLPLASNLALTRRTVRELDGIVESPRGRRDPQ